MFSTLLIANRGEIACRIIRTARRLGIRTVAVYSTADARALHVAMADEAYCIGPPLPGDSYLAIPRIIDAARKSAAAAVHPGYGFLSENADFAEACVAAGLIFVGPPAAAIRAMGDKAQAKTLMMQHGVAVVPGYHDADQTAERLAGAARRIGYPLLVKAAFGGGGRGMRIVATPRDLAPGLAAARREAETAFGNGQLILEKYLAPARHVEVQIFADQAGNTIHLFERECSVQRRHQKVIEEAPAPGLDEATRATLGATAVAAARAVGYIGAGTVEFIGADGAFYFMEMNTRLQVEHAVTEMITGQDLVEWQLRIAAGEPLPLGQTALHRQGHAVETRLYAEDPARDFLPASGTLLRLRFPEAMTALRIETGVREGDGVGLDYDPLLAKLIAWGEDRATAVRRLAAALAATRVVGVVNNREFLLRLVEDADFAAGTLDTGIIARRRATLLPEPTAAPLAAIAAAILALLGDAAAARGAAPANSPWLQRDGWRLFGEAASAFRLRDRTEERAVRVVFRGVGKYLIECGAESAAVRLIGAAAGDIQFDLDEVRRTAAVVRQGDALTLCFDRATYRFQVLDWLAPPTQDGDAARRLTAPMPGKVLDVLVAPGTAVKRGQIMMVLEAMKMEHAIAAPADGVVAAVHFAAGDLVAEGALLLAFDPTSG